MYGYIYLTTNLIDGKKYIGRHKSGSFDPNYKGSGKALWNAINKYGWDNFKVELLEECESHEQLCDREITIIEMYNAVASENFYNITPGGDGGVGYGEANPFYGKHHSEEFRTLQSIRRKGVPMSDKTRAIMSSSKLGNTNRLGTKDSQDTINERIQKSSLGRVWITDGVFNKRIYPDELSTWTVHGWRLGSTLHTKGMKRNLDTIMRMKLGNKNKCYNLQCTICDHKYLGRSPTQKCPLCSGKGRKAKELGVKIVTESQFINIVKENN